MSSKIYIIIFLLLIKFANAQNVERMVFNNNGQAFQNSSFIFESSFGETVVGTDYGIAFSGFVLPDSANMMFGINEIIEDQQGVRMFPNPNEGVFSLKSETEIVSVEVYDSKGVLSKEINNVNSKRVEVNAGLSPGLYHILIYQSSKIIPVHKSLIIIQNN